MAKIWKISDAASIGLHAMVLLATTRDRLVRTRDIASLFQFSEAHLSKVLQRLAKAGLVKATRGPAGGFSLKTDPEKITLFSVYEAIEGPFLSSNCLLEHKVCGGNSCILGGLIEEVNEGIKDYLEKTTLSGLVDVYDGIDLDCDKGNSK